VQLAILNITDRQAEYAASIQEILINQGVRASLDLRNEKIGFKIREHTLQRVPYLIVVGDREAQNNEVAVRTRSGKDLGSMPLEQLVQRLTAEIAGRGLHLVED
jgi:threonyl-tRNA synthetase